MVNIVRVVPDISSRTDIHTYVLITIRRTPYGSVNKSEAFTYRTAKTTKRTAKIKTRLVSASDVEWRTFSPGHFPSRKLSPTPNHKSNPNSNSNPDTNPTNPNPTDPTLTLSK